MNRRTYLVVLTCLTLLATADAAWASPPDDFPRFQVPGHEQEMATLRELFWLHYPGAGPKATLWDEWLPDARALARRNHRGQGGCDAPGMGHDPQRAHH